MHSLIAASPHFSENCPRGLIAPILIGCEIDAMKRRPHGQIDPEAGNRIREFRLKKRWSLHDLAAESGFSYQSVQRWETTGKIPVKKLAHLAKVLDVTPADLLPGSEAPRLDDLSDGSRYLLDRFESASPEIQRAILRSVKGLTDRDEAAFEVRPPVTQRR